MGPLLAGLAGYGWAMLPPFVSIFALWLMVLRPHQWPQTYGEWLHSQAWVSAFSQVVTQTLLVCVLFGIGRGIGGVLGHLPMFHPFLPVAISLVSLPVLRLFWSPEKALETGLTIEETLLPMPKAQETAPVAPAAEAAVLPLLALADDAQLSEVGPILEEAMDDATAWARLQVLVTALEAAPGRHAALRHALVIWATEPDHFVAQPTLGGLRAAFAAAGRDTGLLRQLMPRAVALVRAMPDRRMQFPDPGALALLAISGLPRDLVSGLQTLVASLTGEQPADRAKRRSRVA